MKVLITGSSGYVGYVLSRFFTDRGVPVVGLDLAPNRAWEGHERFRFRACDVTRRAALAEAFREERPTHVIHLAFLMNPIHDARREHEIDVGGSINVLEEAQRTVSVRQLVLMSSTSAYGAWPTHRPWIPETAPLRPRDYRYGQHKQEVEERFASAAVGGHAVGHGPQHLGDRRRPGEADGPLRISLRARHAGGVPGDRAGAEGEGDTLSSAEREEQPRRHHVPSYPGFPPAFVT